MIKTIEEEMAQDLKERDQCRLLTTSNSGELLVDELATVACRRLCAADVARLREKLGEHLLRTTEGQHAAAMHAAKASRGYLAKLKGQTADEEFKPDLRRDSGAAPGPSDPCADREEMLQRPPLNRARIVNPRFSGFRF